MQDKSLAGPLGIGHITFEARAEATLEEIDALCATMNRLLERKVIVQKKGHA